METLFISMKGALLIFLILCCRAFADNTDSTELQTDVQYVVGIDSKAKTSTDDSKQTTVITSASGQKFRCTLPSSSSTPISSPPSSASDEASPKAALERLRKAYEGKCFTKVLPSDTYWTYEVCPFRTVRQYHPNSPAPNPDFGLGNYDSSADVIGGANAVYSQSYPGGTSNRHTEVLFQCQRGGDPKSTDIITAVKEPTVHQYVITISTPLACNIAPPRIGNVLQPLGSQGCLMLVCLSLLLLPIVYFLHLPPLIRTWAGGRTSTVTDFTFANSTQWLPLRSLRSRR